MSLFDKLKGAINSAVEAHEAEKQRKIEEKREAERKEAERRRMIAELTEPLEERLNAGDASAAVELSKLYEGTDFYYSRLEGPEYDDCRKLRNYLRKGAALKDMYCIKTLLIRDIEIIRNQVRWTAQNDDEIDKDFVICGKALDPESEMFRQLVEVEKMWATALWNAYVESANNEYMPTHTEYKTAAYKLLSRAAKQGDEDAEATLHTLF